jgi:dipeptidyl aminopeptidase/acylaminoacyl peptidase
MRYILLIAVLTGLVTPVQQAPPATEVFLASIDPTTGGMLSWVNISNSPGYDNQPSFLPDSSAVLFTSNRDGKQTDIWRHDIARKMSTRVTDTPEAEYSPTMTPDGRTFSVIRVEADGTQRLWRFNLDGSNPRLVLENVKPVGYHAWIDATHLALFVLGADSAPATLQIADTTTGTAEVMATGIGRSVLIRPKTGTVSYMTSGQSRMIKELDPKTKASTDLIAPLANSQDAAWLPDGRLLMAAGTTISVWKPGATEWVRWDGTEPPRIASEVTGPITRLAVSPNGRYLAFVAELRK